MTTDKFKVPEDLDEILIDDSDFTPNDGVISEGNGDINSDDYRTVNNPETTFDQTQAPSYFTQARKLISDEWKSHSHVYISLIATVGALGIIGVNSYFNQPDPEKVAEQPKTQYPSNMKQFKQMYLEKMVDLNKIGDTKKYLAAEQAMIQWYDRSDKMLNQRK